MNRPAFATPNYPTMRCTAYIDTGPRRYQPCRRAAKAIIARPNLRNDRPFYVCGIHARAFTELAIYRFHPGATS